MKTVIVTRAACDGSISAISSKSDVHRALIAAALTKPPTEIDYSGTCDDLSATISCLVALGARITARGEAFLVSRGDSPKEEALLNAGESGSTLRFLLPVAAALGVSCRVVGGGRLPARPLLPLLDALRENGAVICGDALPLSLSGRARAGVYKLPGNVSSQWISGLLLALPMAGGRSEICLTAPLQSEPYVEMTLGTLRAFGVSWERSGNRFLLADGAHFSSPGVYTAEGDWSAAAVHLVSGALGGRVTVSGLPAGSKQADSTVVDLLGQAGAKVKTDRDRVTVTAGELRPFSLDVSSCPDLFPILAVLAAGAKGISRLGGGERLRWKESDRIASTAAMLRALGGEVDEMPDGLTVRGGRRLRGGIVDGAGDHRIVMAAAAARALCDRDVVIRGADAVSKSYPGFFRDCELLKGASHEIILR